MYFIIVGCGKVGLHLAKILSEEHNVVVVDRDPESVAALKPVFNGITVVGNGVNLDTLREAGIEKCDALAAVTSDDNTNIVVGQIASRIFKVRKSIIRITDPDKSDLYRNLGHEVINGAYLVAEVIRDKLIERSFSTYLLESSRLSTLEVPVDSRRAGKTVADFHLPDDFSVIAVVRRDGPIIPSPSLPVQEGDVLIGVVRVGGLKRVKRFLDLP